jgi:hypothetical protein
MFSGFDAEWRKSLAEISARIDELERRELEGASVTDLELADIVGGKRFLSVEGLAAFWNAQADSGFAQHIADLLTGTHGQQQAELIFVLAGNDQGLALYLSLGALETTESMLKALLPGIHLDSRPAGYLASKLERHFRVHGMLSGVPGHKGSFKAQEQQRPGEQQPAGLQVALPASTNAAGFSQFERVIRGMQGATWTYIVHARPSTRKVTADQRLKMIDWLTWVVSQSRIQRQNTEQITGIASQTFSGEMVNYRAQYLTRLLERQVERLDSALACGQWWVSSYFGASTQDDAQRLAGLLIATLAGEDSRPEPMRAYLCNPTSSKILQQTAFSTYLSSEELATMVQFPREEVPGYAISDFVRFDVDFRHAHSKNLALGHIQHNNQDSTPYTISLHDLAKHAVVVGVTGSGKTTSVMNLLDHLVQAGLPFLILEPAKTEYRTLRPRLAGRADARIYTLGNENIAPFRLNPFEFETDDRPGSASVTNHIDFLKAVFNAAFILYAPMPYVLEVALHEIYEDKGWDLASGLNVRLPKWSERHLYPIFPTLTDLYYKIDEVVNRFHYDPHTDQTVKAGLKARIGSMRVGTKGLMLDTARGIPMSQLLSHPTILEMENIGSDDEKTFLMGMLLAKLYEYRRLQASSGSVSADLQHLLVFEEAHRLLKNTETQVDTESSNLRGQAIEVFTNMLSEVRAYGQGVLVAEQIPSKLAPDVLKNTNLKIAHRLVAMDDRQSIGQTMNLTSEQTYHLGILPPGMAAVFAEGADHAYKVRMENYKSGLAPLTDTQLKAESPRYASVEACQFILDFRRYGVLLSPFGSPDALIYQYTARLLSAARGQVLWSLLLLRTVFSRPQLPQAIKLLEQYLTSELPSVQGSTREATLRMFIIQGCAELLQKYGAIHGWSYPVVDELRIPLTSGLLTFVQKNDLALASSDLDRFSRRYEKLLERNHGPFPGCEHCPAPCLYRTLVRWLLTKSDREWLDDEVKAKHATPADHYTAIARVAKNIVHNWPGDPKNSVVPELAYCAALHVEAGTDLTAYEQQKFADQLKAALL